MKEDEEIVSWLTSHEEKYVSRCSKEVGVGKGRVRRVAAQNHIQLQTSRCGSEAFGLYDILEREARKSMDSGYGLDNGIGALVALACGISMDDLMTMACGGTVTFCMVGE